MISGQIPTSALACVQLCSTFCTSEVVLCQGREPRLLALVFLLDSHWLSAIGSGGGSGTRGMCPVFQESKEESHTCKPFTARHTAAGGGMTRPEKGLTGIWLGHQLYPSPQAWGISCPLQSLRSRMITQSVSKTEIKVQ